MRTPPLFNGKVWIGSAYQYPVKNLVESHDACKIQLALLNKKDRSLLAFFRRLLGS